MSRKFFRGFFNGQKSSKLQNQNKPQTKIKIELKLS